MAKRQLTRVRNKWSIFIMAKVKSEVAHDSISGLVFKFIIDLGKRLSSKVTKFAGKRILEELQRQAK